MPAIVDLQGMKFGRLSVVDRAVNRGRRVMWKCRCECGNDAVVAADNLRSGGTSSCGCLHQEAIERHGYTSTSEYRSWAHMIQRCTNQKYEQWMDYGGRGISVCESWRSSFANFLLDMGPKPTPQHSIDRYPNNDGNYEPGNCRWATRKQQQANRRNSIKGAGE